MAPDPLFNIALRPIHSQIAAKLIGAAQQFADVADQYLLGPGALPHATMCFFRAPAEDVAKEAFASWKAEHHLDVTLAAYKVNDSQDAQGIWWTAIHTVQDKPLLSLQKSCFDHLTSLSGTLGIEALTSPASYDPHFTLARCRTFQSKQPNPTGLPQGLVIPCFADVGRATEIGVFVKSLVVDSQRHRQAASLNMQP